MRARRPLAGPRAALLRGLAAALAAACWLAASPAGAAPPAADLQPGQVPPLELQPGGLAWGAAARFVGGVGTAFLVHEGCHLAANLALGNTPTIERVTFLGAVPFFAVAPGIRCSGDRCVDRAGRPFGPGPAGLYTIVTAGLQCQQYSDEVILTRRPDLRREEAPFLKGMLAFNTLASVAYVFANQTGTEPAAGDLHGAIHDARAPRAALNALVLSVAALDLARYAWPDVPWLAWVSRACKVTVTGVAFTLR